MPRSNRFTYDREEKYRCGELDLCCGSKLTAHFFQRATNQNSANSNICMAHKANPLSGLSLSRVPSLLAAGAPKSNFDPLHTEPTISKVDGVTEAVAEDTEMLHASIKTGSIAQVVVAVIAVIGLIYLLKFVMVTI